MDKNWMYVKITTYLDKPVFSLRSSFKVMENVMPMIIDFLTYLEFAEDLVTLYKGNRIYA
jgi:hypothetical protein